MFFKGIKFNIFAKVIKFNILVKQIYKELLLLFFFSFFFFFLILSFKLIKQNGIKCDEIHIKIGGDFGGGSFKMSYQIVNQDQPNSKSNSIVFSTFEAKDYRTNLIVGLSRYTLQVDEIQNMIWQ